MCVIYHAHLILLDYVTSMTIGEENESYNINCTIV
jgi:hypothetical protein